MKSAVVHDSIAVIGLGYVGLPLAVRAAEKGYTVIGIDRDEEKIASINKGVSPFLDDDLTVRLTRISKSLEATTDVTRIAQSSIVVVCVPTPVNEDHSPDLEPLKGAAMAIAPHLKPGVLVIIESTVNPGVCEEVVLPILLEHSNPEHKRNLFLAHCPERINPGDETWNVSNIPRVVGATDARGLRQAVAFYQSIVDGQIYPMESIAAAEAVKMVENSFRDINIAFVNELAMSFSKLGIDVVDVIKGASTKPFAFMPHFPGCGVGGHCIPVDPYYLIEYGRQNGFAHRFLSIARHINNNMPSFTVDMLEESLMERNMFLTDTPVTVLGLAYKPDIDDYRESPALAIIEEIKARGGTVVAFDPFVLAQSNVTNLDDALAASPAVVVATAHKAFSSLTPRDFVRNGVEIVVDGRNCLAKHLFTNSALLYRGIGRDSNPRRTALTKTNPTGRTTDQHKGFGLPNVRFA